MSLTLTSALHNIDVGTPIPVAEQSLLDIALAHHVVDESSLLGLDPLSSHPIRHTLHRLAGRGPWMTSLASPGRLGGLTGPASLTQDAVEHGAAVISQRGELALVPRQVGPAVQWVVHSANRPLLPADPSQMSTRWVMEIQRAAADMPPLTGDDTIDVHLRHPPKLGPAYPRASQRLLDRVWPVRIAVRAALSHEQPVLTSHSAMAREDALRSVERLATETIESVMAWPAACLAG